MVGAGSSPTFKVTVPSTSPAANPVSAGFATSSFAGGLVGPVPTNITAPSINPLARLQPVVVTIANLQRPGGLNALFRYLLDGLARWDFGLNRWTGSGGNRSPGDTLPYVE
jgi:hypothetical protein